MGFRREAGERRKPKKSAVQFMVEELTKRDYSARQLTENSGQRATLAKKPSQR